MKTHLITSGTVPNAPQTIVVRLAMTLAALTLVSARLSLAATVSNLNDGGPGSLREAIASAPPGTTINFAVSGTIMVTNGEFGITKDLTIAGPPPGLPVVTLHANYKNRLFFITKNVHINISNLEISGGESGTDNGGGIYNTGTLTLNRCNLDLNGAFSGGSGGGIFNNGLLTLNNCTVHDNTAVTGPFGGGILNSNSLTVNNCTIYYNSAAAGGAIYNAGVLSANNSTFYLNFCSSAGAGIYNVGDQDIVNCTICGNSCNAAGGGIYQSDISGVTLIRNSIVVSNTASGGGRDVYGRMGFGLTGSRGHNLVGNPIGSTGWGNSDLLGVDPLLGPFSIININGGPTPTMALLSGSPAIDAADDAVIGSPYYFTTDQRGRPRLTGAHVDIGAYESGSSPLVTNNDDDGPGSLRNAILVAAPTEVITFASNVVGSIALLSGELVIGQSRNILGPGANVLTVSGNNTSRVFHITGGASQIANLRIAQGNTSKGGGGIAIDNTVSGIGGTSLILSNCAISDCYADGFDVASQGGGAIAMIARTTLSLVNSTLSSNSTRYYGGGLYLFNGAKASVINSTISGNKTLDDSNGDAWGGGIFMINGSSLSVINSTVAYNTSPTEGGGVYKGFSGTGTFQNSLIAGNSASFGPDCQGTFVSAGYNLIGNTSGSSGFGVVGDRLNVNPLLFPLANNGGQTLTHALFTGSPAIDAGGIGGPPTDQRGASRPFDFPSVSNAGGGDSSDIGAFEVIPPTPAIGQQAGTLLISWPSYYTGYALQVTADVNSSTGWSTMTNTPSLIGDQYVVTLNTTNGSQFFRLIGP